MNLPVRSTLIATGLFATPALAQGPALTSPGMSTYSSLGQTTRFSTEFNPAIGFVIDGVADYRDIEGGTDGFDADLRLLEINAAAFVDPDAWAYVVLTSEDLEAPEVEEAAVEYIGFEGNSTIRAGRFFVDFGKQMQSHLEEIRTLERPFVLREYLGDELAGTGVQWDHWFVAGEEIPVRFSIAVFESLVGGHGHGEEEAEGVEQHVAERKSIDDFAFTARLTGMTDVGENGTLQLGVSARLAPEFAFESEADGLEVDGQSNIVYGIDGTIGWVDESGQSGLTTGFEYLVYDGDIAAEVVGGNLVVVDDTVSGFYVFGDYAFDQYDSVGLQLSHAELPEDPNSDVTEYDAYWSHNFTEFRRLRFGLTFADLDNGTEETRAYVQFTNFFGSHAHGINW